MQTNNFFLLHKYFYSMSILLHMLFLCRNRYRLKNLRENRVPLWSRQSKGNNGIQHVLLFPQVSNTNDKK